jgi:hypothetical protein
MATGEGRPEIDQRTAAAPKTPRTLHVTFLSETDLEASFAAIMAMIDAAEARATAASDESDIPRQ